MSPGHEIAKVSVTRAGEFHDTWRMAQAPVAGTVLVYDVVDGNSGSDNSWTFYVQVPVSLGTEDCIIVRPNVAPSREDLVPVERRAVCFPVADRPGYRGKIYCKINLADPTGQRTKVGVRFDQIARLPTWLSSFRSQMHPKEEIRQTKGADGLALVVVFDKDDHAGMIRLFFATRIWPLTAGFTMGRR